LAWHYEVLKKFEYPLLPKGIFYFLPFLKSRRSGINLDNYRFQFTFADSYNTKRQIVVLKLLMREFFTEA